MKSKDSNFKGNYSEWLTSNKSLLDDIENHEFITNLGSTVIQILKICNMVKSELIIKSKDQKYYILTVNKDLLDIRSKSMIYFPLKLPMIVKPNEYGNNKLGGYLLNDVKYSEQLIIKKNIIKNKSFIKNDNVIYNMINNINSTPYKINTELIDYISTQFINRYK